MAVLNGSAIAGGLLYALCHDFRIMKQDKPYVCLSEINIGMSLPVGFASVVRNAIPSQAARLLCYGGRFGSDQCLKMGIIDNTYKDN